MSIKSITPLTQDRLVRLPWDSSHFGFPVGRIEGDLISDDALRGLLLEARDNQYELVYWSTPSDRSVADEILNEFSGLRTTGRVTYTRLLKSHGMPPPTPQNCAIVEYPRCSATPQLIELALAAGEYSRFHFDPRIRHEDFVRLYTIWMQRSTLGEIADGVIVARDTEQGIVAMATVGLRQSRGTIGLIAVAAACRGRGLGRALLSGLEQWLTARGATDVEVVTQTENQAARRLYENWGCTLIRTERMYHFWPLTAAASG